MDNILLCVGVIGGTVAIVLLFVNIFLHLSARIDKIKYDAELEKMKHICAQCQSHKCNDCVWRNN